ncbi:toxin glutamine deamidase domain-containing protein [Actinokineospora auranticolor]|uniref:Papain fold toxin 1 (Glutamine deamidase) of polymorphic toxin system n=1 Tax=Actinokineospora auranticolor TaxID=155976 RepID=A0A2S6H153_9PSEU|nr:toxin glutamine deamidase domain-containing protein [Actinokineospora auranticolor]PPK71205.1 papain fold toxin 1 (glutamine deamidase) of polymorphic toxin system [Actinokineospora auranticolor]
MHRHRPGEPEKDQPTTARPKERVHPVHALQQKVGNSGVNRLMVQRTRDMDTTLNDLDNIRQFGQPGGLDPASTAAEQRLANSFPQENGQPQQFPDPSAHLPGAGLAHWLNAKSPKGPAANTYGTADWVANINSQRDEPGTAFLRNCIDAARAFLKSWYGRPTAAAGVHDPAPGLESDGGGKTKQWLETEWRTSENGRGPTWSDIEARLKSAGHGAVAIVIFDRGTIHAVNGVNHNGNVYWVDPQMGHISKKPLYEMQGPAESITLNAQFQPVDEPPPLTTSIEAALAALG